MNNKIIFEIPSSFQMEAVRLFSCANGDAILFRVLQYSILAQYTVL